MPANIDIEFLTSGSIQLHGDEIEKTVKKLLAGAKERFQSKMGETFQAGLMRKEALTIMAERVNKNSYSLSSTYKRDATIKLRDALPGLKGDQIKAIVQSSSDELATSLQDVASASVRENLKVALANFAAQAAADFQSSFWSAIGDFFVGVAKAAARFFSFGIYNDWAGLEESIASNMVAKVEELNVVPRACQKFASVLDSQENNIVEYVRKKVAQMQEAQAAPEVLHIELVFIEEEDKKAKEFAPWEGVLWCDPNIRNAENTGYCATFKGIYKERFHACEQPEEAVKHLDDNPMTCFTVITAGTNGERLAKMLGGRLNVERLTVFCRNTAFHQTWARAFEQALHATVHSGLGEVVSALEKVRERPLAGFVTKDEIIDRLRESMRISQHSDVQDLAEQLDTMDCVRQLLRARDGGAQAPEGEAKAMFDVLTDWGDSTRTIALWTGNRFCYTLTKELRTCRRDARLLMICRLAELVSMHHTKLGRTTGHAFRGHVFRGLKISDASVFESYAASKGKHIFFREFMATSEKQSIANSFGSGAEFTVLLRIDATGFDASVPCPLRIRQWSQYGSEEEVLFPLFSGFEVDNVMVSANRKVASLDLTFTVAVPDPSAAFIYAFL